ncbi:hypothetical protein [Thaumasiovibrio subtropicus]|uniref:hypothetical protein n=1 Tax=Thaumasiovibrio subtropicus TaxID=1891207 RepID=UPI000B3510D8|nr:hypothetical protein [Thaumasiovibrio subtropicus]
MKNVIRTVFAVSLISSATQVSAYDMEKSEAFKTLKGMPDPELCQLYKHRGKTFFDPASGRLWACSDDGWAYFESKLNDHLSCLDEAAQSAQYPEWKKRHGFYKRGEVVSYKGLLYTPRNSGVWGSIKPARSWEWLIYTPEDLGVARWDSTREYSAGQHIVHMGIEYVAHSYNANKAPNDYTTNYQPWDKIGPYICPES